MNKAHLRWMFPLAGVAILCLAGCVNMGKSYTQKRLFAFQMNRRTEQPTPGTTLILRVKRSQVSPRFEERGFVYRKGEWQYDADFYNAFFRPPGVLLTEEVRKWLEKSGLFSHVVDAPSLLQADYLLEPSLDAVYGDYQNPKAPKAVLEMGFALLGIKSDVPRLVFKQRYHEEQPLESRDPEFLMQGWNRALEAILRAFEKDLRNSNTID